MIAKGQKNGLDFFLERTGYKNDEKYKVIEIYYDSFCLTPSGERCFEQSFVIQIKDMPETQEQLNEERKVLVPYSPAKNPYTDYCNRFGATEIGKTIDEYLISI